MSFQPYGKQKKPAETAGAIPLGAEEFSSLIHGFGPFSTPLHPAVAVSGGPDSMALAFCVKRWLDGEHAGNKVLALIVDHGLRAESPAEAEQTQKALEAIGIRAEILCWEHPPVVTRLHENARKARYRLLTEACRRNGIETLLLAHQREDQAETILMRLAKGSGIDGLAGMAAQKTFEGVRILRPCLGIPKERLAATCAAAGLPVVSDPSNHSQKFARGRLRRILPLLAIEGLTIERLNDLGARAADAKAALDHATKGLLRVAAMLDGGGVIEIDLEHLRSAPRAIALRALGFCLQGIQPEEHAPEHVSLARLADALRADAEMPSRTLHGCLIGKNKTRAAVMREYAAITDAPPIEPGESIVWDKRWRVTLSANIRENFIVRPLGNPPHEILDRLAPGLRRQVPQGRVRASLPGLWLNDALALIPALPHSSYTSGTCADLVTSQPPEMGENG